MEAVLALDREVQMRMCRVVLRSLAAGRRPNAIWFRDPVDLEDNPDYLDFIDRPMDFRTINSKLNNKAYRSAAEFDQDIRLVFQNCYTYNPEKHEAYQAAVNLEDVLNKKWLELAADSHNFRTSSRAQDDSGDQAGEDFDHPAPIYSTRRRKPRMTRPTQLEPALQRRTAAAGRTKAAPRPRSSKNSNQDMLQTEGYRTDEPIPAKEASPMAVESNTSDEPASSEHTNTSSPVSETPTAVDQLKSGTYVLIELGVTRILGVVRKSVAYSSDPAKKELFQLRPVGDEGPIDRTLIVGVENLSKTEYQVDEEVTLNIKVGTQETSVTTRIGAVKVIDDVVHYDVEVQGQTVTVTGDAFK